MEYLFINTNISVTNRLHSQILIGIKSVTILSPFTFIDMIQKNLGFWGSEELQEHKLKELVLS